MILGNIEFTRLIGVEIQEREVNGKVEKCISIPIRPNGLLLSHQDRVYMDIMIKERRPNPDNISHYISVNIHNPKLMDEIKTLGYEMNLKFFGRAKVVYKKIANYRARISSLEKALES